MAIVHNGETITNIEESVSILDSRINSLEKSENFGTIPINIEQDDCRVVVDLDMYDLDDSEEFFAVPLLNLPFGVSSEYKIVWSDEKQCRQLTVTLYSQSHFVGAKALYYATETIAGFVFYKTK